MATFKCNILKKVPVVTTMEAIKRSFNRVMVASILIFSVALIASSIFTVFAQDEVIINVLNPPTTATIGTMFNFDWTISGVTNFNGGHTNLHCFADDTQH